MLLRISMLLAVIWASEAHSAMNDRELARACAKQAAAFLGEDLGHKKGKVLFYLARALAPESDDVLLITGYLNRKRTPPMPTKLAPYGDLLKQLKKRAHYYRKGFRYNANVGEIALLYLRVADRLDPTDYDVLKGIAYLHSYGVSADLKTLLARKYDPRALEGNRKTAKKVGSILSDEDTDLAQDAIRVGTKMLAADGSSAHGLVLVRFGHHLLPNDSRGLLALLQLQRSMKVKPLRTKTTVDKLRKQIIRRATKHLGDAQQSHKLRKQLKNYKVLPGHLALLLYKVAEQLANDDPKAMIGLIKLKKIGLESDIDELLNSDLDSIERPDVPTEGLVVHYAFDHDSMFNEVTRKRDLKPFNGAKLVEMGYRGGACFFDGKDDYLAAEGKPGPIAGTGEFTLMAWVKPKRLSSGTLIQQRDGRSISGQYVLCLEEGGIYYYEYNGGFGLQIHADVRLNTDKWAHVALTRTSSGGQIYVNGRLIASQTKAPKNILAARTFAVGIDYRGDAPTNTKWSPYFGYIDEVRMYSRALSADELSAFQP